MRNVISAGVVFVAMTSQAFAAGTYFRQSPSDIALPTSNSDTTIVSVVVPAGTWEIEGVLQTQNFMDDDIVDCDIIVGGTNFLASGTLATGVSSGFVLYARIPLIGAVKTTGTATTIVLGCRKENANTHVNIRSGSTLLVHTTQGLK